MSAVTKVAGYPVHAVAQFKRWGNQHGALFTDWWAACGAVGTDSGHQPFKLAGSARRGERCRVCFPGRDTTPASAGDPVEVRR